MLQILLDGLLCGLCLCYLIACPYTKVEESFNLQATHDILYHGTDLHKYDHLEFPGVVPRTFLGPLVVSGISFPLVKVASAFGAEKIISQYIVRGVLGILVCLSFISYRKAVSSTLGSTVGSFLSLVTASQFHFLFYSSRPLPNTFALIFVLLALRCWLLQRHVLFMWLSGASIILFRSELSLLLGLVLLYELWSGRLTVKEVLKRTIPAGILLLTLTVAVDSVFWRRWVWPEGEVLWFNTVHNKSHLWGTSPIWWYFLSALPRSLLLSLPFVPWALLKDKRSWVPFLPALGFVCLYSLLPHKELRFIIYSVPLFNLVSAMGLAVIWINRKKLPFYFQLAVVSSLLLSLGMSLCFLSIAKHNYPGGNAFHQLHSLDIDDQLHTNNSELVSVHIGVEAAMTGVSRFGEVKPSWTYSKKEGLSPESEELRRFTFLLVSTPDSSIFNATHGVLLEVDGFSRLGFSFGLGQFPPAQIVLEPKITVLRKRSKCKKKDA